MDKEMTVFEKMEQSDEAQVLAEIKGQAIDELVYRFRGDGPGGWVTGLSLAGVRETVRQMNTRGIARIRVSDHEPTWIESESYYECRVYAFDSRSGAGWWGLSRQAKNMKVHAKGDRGQWLREEDGSWVWDESPDDFAAQKCMSKAQRNALRGLIPEWFVKEIIASFLKGEFKKPLAQRTNEPRLDEPVPEVGEADEARPAQTNGAKHVVAALPATTRAIQERIMQESAALFPKGFSLKDVLTAAVEGGFAYPKVTESNFDSFAQCLAIALGKE
jgi:hypothetical protein